MADLHTPVGAYLRLRDLHPMSALMESSDYHDRANSRSFICTEPLATIAVAHGKCAMSLPDGSREERAMGESYRPEHALREFMDRRARATARSTPCASSWTASPWAARARGCAASTATRRSTP